MTSMFEPRRLRESPERPSSVEGRLARQLRVLSVFAPMPQLRRYSALPRRRRHLLMAARVAAVAIVVLTVSGAATAMATFVVRRVWSRPAAVDPAAGPAKLAMARHRGKTLAAAHGSRVDGPEASHPAPQAELLPGVASLAEPARAAAQEPDLAVAAVASGAATPSSEHPVTPPSPRSRPSPPKHSDSQATEPPRPLAAAAPTPLAQAVEPTTPPSPPPSPPLPAQALPSDLVPSGPSLAGSPPTGTPGSEPSGRATSPVRADGVAQEAGLLRQALAALRRDHDAKRALALLDGYDRSHGQGALAQEATSVRAQALLALGDNRGALELLDRLPLGQGGRTGELQVIRGELRSLSGRCQDALLDFDAALRSPAGHTQDEIARALFGRASCRARTGDAFGAEQDRQRYLREFPHGPAARQLLSPR
jgi:hypothetical protein